MNIKEIKLEEVSLENKRQFCKELIMSFLTEEEWKEVKDEFQEDLNKSTDKTINLLLRGKNVYGFLVCMSGYNHDRAEKYRFMLTRFKDDGFEEADYLAKKYLNYER
jgi:spore maturation protein CgeB